MLITDVVVKNLRKPGRYTDDQTKGLHLWVKSDGRRYWIFRYTVAGKRYGLSLGPYPEVSLKLAREKAIETRVSINRGSNPSEERHVEKASATVKSQLFEPFAREYVEKMRPKWRSAKHASQWLNTLSTYAFPILGKLRLDEVDTPHVLMVLEPIWLVKPETASRLRGRLEKILTAAIARKERVAFNPASWTGHLEALMPPSPKSDKHHAALPYSEVASFIEELQNMGCLSAMALEFTILNANRTDEVLKAKWNEIVGDIWTIPGERMKAGRDHVVPLGQRSMDLLAMARVHDPNSEYVFSHNGQHLSNMAMLGLVKRMNVGITVHGFRSTFRDYISEETDLSPELAEMQLAHRIPNQVERAYRRGNLLDKRRRMMGHWENFCLGRHVENVWSIERGSSGDGRRISGITQ